MISAGFHAYQQTKLVLYTLNPKHMKEVYAFEHFIKNFLRLSLPGFPGACFFVILLMISATSFAYHTTPTQFYVSPAGLATGRGSATNPWDLQTALNQPAAVIPGSVICM